MSDDDWFEQARQDIDDETPNSDDSDGNTGTATDTETSSTDHEDQSESEDTASSNVGDGQSRREVGFEFTNGPSGETDPTGGVPDIDSSQGSNAESTSGIDIDERSDSEPGYQPDMGFGTSAGQNAESPTGTHSPAGSDGDDSVSLESTSPEEFGFGDFGGDETGGLEFGADEELFGGSEHLDDESIDSEVDRVKLGIEGLDEMIRGGIPRRSLITTIGSPGTGKTTFAVQFLAHTLASGDRGVYITLEESREAILSTAEEMGYPFREYEENDNLVIVALDPVEMANSLSSIRDELTTLIDEFDATRLVLDSVSLLEMMYTHPAERRSEVFGFTRSLKQAGVTTLLTSEASEDTPYSSRHGIVEYLTDAVLILQYVRPSDFQQTRLAVEIQKIRDTSHSRETKPYEITDEGLSVYRQANIF